MWLRTSSRHFLIVVLALFTMLFFSATQTVYAELTLFETEDFSGSGICALCHSGLRDAAGNDVSNDAHRRSTMMANSSKDPFWQLHF